MDADDQYSEDEIARRMERGLRRALNTPPQPHGKNPRSPALKKRRVIVSATRDRSSDEAAELPLLRYSLPPLPRRDDL